MALTDNDIIRYLRRISRSTRKLRIVFDHDVPQPFINWLLTTGYILKHYKVNKMVTDMLTDLEIAHRAKKLHSTLITKDQGFWSEGHIKTKDCFGIIILLGDSVEELARSFMQCDKFIAEALKFQQDIRQTKIKGTSTDYQLKFIDREGKIDSIR